MISINLLNILALGSRP